MSNSTSSAFRGLPFESGKRGETMSIPSIRDYIEEISKDDNINVDEYLSNPDNSKVLDLRKDFLGHTIYTNDKFHLLDPELTYTWKNRLFSLWMQIKNIKYCGYKPFDFNVYPEYCDFIYTYKNSTPWKRFKFFVVSQYKELKWAWQYTPDHIVHYNENKPRINWFEDTIKNLFFLNWRKDKNKIIKELKEKGYHVDDNRIWHEPISLDNDKRII